MRRADLDMYLILLLDQDTRLQGVKYLLAGLRLNRRGRTSEAKTASGHDAPAQGVTCVSGQVLDSGARPISPA